MAPAPVEAPKESKAPKPVGKKPKKADAEAKAATLPASAKAALDTMTITCKTDASPLLHDPICFEGLWIESYDLESPDFWSCGVKPLDIESPVCDMETGRWKPSHHTKLEDSAVCGEIPISDDFVVCDYGLK